jgi:cytochrome c556
MQTRHYRFLRNSVLITLALLAATSSGHANDRTRAEGAAKDLGLQLRTALVARMEAEGPVAAIDFCHDQAPIIAAGVAQKHGVRIGRTGVRTRSPANAPTPWQQAVLDDFAAQAQAGTPPPQLRYASSEQLPEGIALRYMQGIGTEAPCLVCHGETLAEPVAQAIKASYPADTATGFREGQLRGAFWVEVPAASGGDARAAISMTDAQREELRAQMRAHLESVQAILAALANSDWDAVGSAAASFGPGAGPGRGMGPGPGPGQGRGQGQGPMHSFRSALPDGWFTFARPMHQAMRAIADEAASGQRSAEVIAELARATAQCTACHASFRID